MVFRREGTYAIVAILVTLVVAGLLFAVPAWSQQGQQEERRSAQTRERDSQQQQQERRSAQTRERVSEAQRDRIEGLSQEQAEDELVQAAQTTNASGDLVGETATTQPSSGVGPIQSIRIDAEDCEIDEDATIFFEDESGDVGIVVNGENARIDANAERVRVRALEDEEGIVFFGEELLLDRGELEVLNSFGIDCGDPGNDDGFDDELLLLLLLELLEDNDNDDNDGNSNDRRDRRDRDDRFRERVDEVLEEEGLIDEDGDGDIDQDDELIDAQEALDGEITDGEFTDADTFDDDGDLDDGVSATADENGAEASTPGAVARAGGDPDELAPETSVPADVVDEIPTSGPLPNTGGVPVATGTVAALVLFGGGLLAVRLVMIWRARRS